MIRDVTQHVAVLLVSLHIPSAQSLKEKRMILRSLKDRAKAKFNVSVCELDGQDKWQVATLGFALIGNEGRHMDSCLQEILSFVDSYRMCEICDHTIEFY